MQKQLTLFEDKYSEINGAILDKSNNYRYLLWRTWNENLPRITFIMLNPSTADAEEDDPTLRRCIGFSKGWGYGSLEIVNLFGYRSSDPKDLSYVCNPIGEENNKYILQSLRRSKKVILAWGTKGKLLGRDKEVVNLIHENKIPMYALELTKEGHPRHPLYVKAEQRPSLFIPKG